MSIAVDLGRKATKQTNKQILIRMGKSIHIGDHFMLALERYIVGYMVGNLALWQHLRKHML